MKSKFDMYYGASDEIREKAKGLRRQETKHEKLLWDMLKSKQFEGIKFRRQHPISTFIVDFYAHSEKLVLEVDGSSHNSFESKEYDSGRTFELEKFGIKVLRFTNYEIENKMNEVLKTIKKYIEKLRIT